MVSRKVRFALLVGVVAAAVALGGCVGSDTDATTTASPGENATVSPGDDTTVSSGDDSATNESATDDVASRFEQRMSTLDSYHATVVATSRFDGNRTNTTTEVWARPETGEVRREVVDSPYNEGSITVANESEVVTYNPDSNEVTRVNRSKFGDGSTGVSMVDAMASTMSVEPLGTESIDGQQTYRVSLEPDSEMARGNANMTAWLDADTYFPVRIETTSDSERVNFSSVIEFETVELNPTIPDDRFTLDAPADANTSNVSLPDTETYDTVDALRANTSMSVPHPDVPANFSFEQGRVTRGDSVSLSLQYANESARLSVTKTNDTTYNGSDDGEPVQIGNRTGQYSEFGASAMVVWSCDGHRYSVSGLVSRARLTDVAASIECP